MNRLLVAVLLSTGYFILQSCATQNHANTIERDKDNVCIIRIVVQLGIEGTDDDVAAVNTQMQDCFKSECFIPCENNKEKGCKVTMHAIVKKWSDIPNDEKQNWHDITMVDDDGLPSNAHLGNPNTVGSFGQWRRGVHPHTYCHETMHLLGLPDKYCSRIYHVIEDSIEIENTCDPPPDPNINCCNPTAQRTRCGTPCPGHEHDLMGTVEPDLSCDNIRDVLSRSGFGSCPDECCSSGHAYDEFFVGPSYLHFGDKEQSFGAYGGTISYTHNLNSKFGLTIDAGYYTKTDKQDDYKQKNNIFTIGAGLTYKPNLFGMNTKLDFASHAYIGMMNYKSKVEIGGVGYGDESKSVLSANLGVSLSYKLNNKIDLRLLQVDYIPAFLSDGTQNNYRVSAGVEINLGK